MSQIEEVELGIEQAKAMIAKRDALQRLFLNKDFELLVKDGYLKDEAVRLVLLKADSSSTGEEAQANINNGITAIGYLDQYFRGVWLLGNQAARSLKEYEDTYAELLAEGE